MISEVTDSAVLLKNIKCMKKYMKIRRDEGGDCFLKWMLHGFLTAAAVCDVRTGRIPNRLIAMMALAGGFYTFLDSGLLSLTLCLGWSAILLAVLFPLFFFRMMGAGDIKVISVLPLFLEKEGWVRVLTLSLITAGMWSAWMMGRKHMIKERFSYLANYVRGVLVTGKRTDYQRGAGQGAALALGAFLWVGMTIFLMQGGAG